MRKGLTLPRNKVFVGIYVIFHCIAILPFLVSLAAGHGLNIDADLFNMLPRPSVSKALAVADERLTDRTTQNVFVLVSHEDFGRAKAVAEQVYAQLDGSPNFSSLELYAGTETVAELSDFLHQWRWNLLDASQAQQLATPEGAQEFADAALGYAYSAFTLSSLDNLEEDPFLLDEVNLQRYMAHIQDSGTAMTARDGVLATSYEGKWYVMIRGTLSKEGSAIASDSNGISQIYRACEPLETDGVQFVYSGTAFHSHESSNSAMHEISIISTVSLAVVIIILLVLFRSPLPLLSSVASIFISIATAFSATHFVFGKMHVLTLVFGTSLIGSCIDYSLHYFVNWKANNALATGAQIRRHLLRGLTLSLLSTEICYFALLFAPFNLLKQMSVFSMTGIFSSFLTVICLYPLYKIPQKEKRTMPLLKWYKVPMLAKRHPWVTPVATLLVFAAAGGVMAASHRHVRVLNNVNSLYTMKGRLEHDADLAYRVLQYLPGAWFVISGDTEEAVLELEERVVAELERVNEGKPAGGLVATSRFIPSVKSQERSYAALDALMPLAPEQFDMLGYGDDEAQALERLYEGRRGIYLTPQSDIPDTISALISQLWLGEIDGRYYSVVMPTSVTDEAAYRAIGDMDPDVYFEDKIADLNNSLDHLTKIILVMFAIAYLVIIVVLKFFYSWKQVAKIASIPLMSVMVIVAVFAASGAYLEFFGITGMILVFGLGLDYVIYLIENNKRHQTEQELQSPTAKLEPFAILLSFVTTAVSFGALALSTFVPVHSLGLAIFLGLVSSFVATLF